MNGLLPLLVVAITAGGALLVALSFATTAQVLVQGRFTTAALDAARFRLASGLLAALGVMTAATLLKTLTLESWSAFALFALVFTLRLLIKRSLTQAVLRRKPEPSRS